MVASNRIKNKNHVILFMAKSTFRSVLNDFHHEITANFCNFIHRNMISITYILI
jgi:hypothetical protein